MSNVCPCHIDIFGCRVSWNGVARRDLIHFKCDISTMSMVSMVLRAIYGMEYGTG